MKRFIFGMGMMILALFLSACGGKNEEVTVSDFHTELFGENVYFFSPDDDPKEIQAILDKTYATQETNQFGDKRYSFYFMPGTYDDSIKANVGYYTQVAGLGMQPTDTVLPEITCLARWLGDDGNHNATCNFWRSVENLEVTGKKTIWAVSQATDMRRVCIDGSLYLHDDNGWASGGFLSDSRVSKMIDSGSQQQWLSRNNEYTTWMGQNWNIVFCGDDPKGIPNGTWPNFSYTKVDETEVIREKPLLVYTEDGFGIFCPDIRKNAVGPAWSEEGEEQGSILPIKDFYVAKEDTDTADTLQKALDEGKHIFFTPGIYELDKPLKVEHDDTIILGTGLATLRAGSGDGVLKTNAEGLTIAGILIDAGSEKTEALAVIGASESEEKSEKPTTLSDVYFRVGGTDTPEPTQADACLIIEEDGVIGDNLWIWRADHGDQVAWDKNVTKNGVIINGNDVTMYALMVEHFHEYQTVWNGEGGRLVMYQSETPYDVPEQSEWKSHDGDMDGYASIYVAPSVESFDADGIGVYLYNRDAIAPLHAAMETPEGEGIDIRHIITVLLTGYPGIEHVINDTGGPVMRDGEKQMVLHYKGGKDLRFD